MSDTSTFWLVLVYQFPKGPDSRRVKVWRRLQRIGAVAIKNSVYVLPANDQSQEDFEWLLAELKGSGADGVIFESQVVDGMNDQQLRNLFRDSRESDYLAVRDDIKALIESLPRNTDDGVDSRYNETRNAVKRVRKRIAEIESIDFFGADNHDAAENELRTLIERLSDAGGDDQRTEKSTLDGSLQNLSECTWVTRRGVKVDRVASAWLIRRWIDSRAKFKFVEGKGYEPEKDEIRFDMFEAEFTHEGDRCTFEVLARLARENDVALQSIAEIVHDIDLKDEKFDRAETIGMENMLAGLFASVDDDNERINSAGVLFDNLYRFFEISQR